MTNRKKRLKRGIESLGKQIELHKEKLMQAQAQGMPDLENYYEKEIESLKRRKKNKEDILEKQ